MTTQTRESMWQHQEPQARGSTTGCWTTELAHQHEASRVTSFIMVSQGCSWELAKLLLSLSAGTADGSGNALSLCGI